MLVCPRCTARRCHRVRARRRSSHSPLAATSMVVSTSRSAPGIAMGCWGSLSASIPSSSLLVDVFRPFVARPTAHPPPPPPPASPTSTSLSSANWSRSSRNSSAISELTPASPSSKPHRQPGRMDCASGGNYGHRCTSGPPATRGPSGMCSHCCRHCSTAVGSSSACFSIASLAPKCGSPAPTSRRASVHSWIDWILVCASLIVDLPLLTCSCVRSTRLRSRTCLALTSLLLTTFGLFAFSYVPCSDISFTDYFQIICLGSSLD